MSDEWISFCYLGSFLCAKGVVLAILVNKLHLNLLSTAKVWKSGWIFKNGNGICLVGITIRGTIIETLLHSVNIPSEISPARS